MNESHVSFSLTQSTVSRIYSPTKFQFRVELGWHWLQKVCFWTLRKIGAQAVEFDSQITRLDIQYKSFMERIGKQQAELMTRYALEGKYLLMGAQDYSELMSDSTYLNHMIHFSIPDAIYRNEDSMDRRTMIPETKTIIMNLNVVIVPWMKGMMVMPELPPVRKIERPVFTMSNYDDEG